MSKQGYVGDYCCDCPTRERLKTQVATLTEALEFYADRETWRGQFPNRPIDKDCDGDFRATPGLKARAALKQKS